MLLVFNSEFLLWTLALLALIIGLSYVFVMGIFTHWVVPIIMAAALVGFGLKWSRQFLVRLIIDYDANNGDGRVIIQRLVPAPNLPETVEFPLQQAAEGSPEVNTKGILNTLISQLAILKPLRALTIGDLTLRGPSAPFGITMYNIMDPAGVRAQLEKDWKKIAALKAKQKAEREKQEEIERIKEGVKLGMQEVLANLRPESLPFLAPASRAALLAGPATDAGLVNEGVEDLSPNGTEVSNQMGGSDGAVANLNDPGTPMGSTEGAGEGGMEGGGEAAAA